MRAGEPACKQRELRKRQTEENISFCSKRHNPLIRIPFPRIPEKSASCVEEMRHKDARKTPSSRSRHPFLPLILQGGKKVDIPFLCHRDSMPSSSPTRQPILQSIWSLVAAENCIHRECDLGPRDEANIRSRCLF